MFVLGTAGHVDHGKSTFLKFLTQMEPDRLPEEKSRGMTIELNFVWTEIEGGLVGIVDVPGHKRFVKNMISGAVNIDAFLFILAADDSWMPQSEEHLGVLKGLGIHRGIGILTKTDLVDESHVREVEAEFKEKLRTAFDYDVPVRRFSAVNPPPREDFLEELSRLLRALPPPQREKTARIWIDRVFVPRGLGVVVTGTLREGILKQDDPVFLMPGNIAASVKSLQAYQCTETQLAPVSRVAVQLSKVSATQVKRGMLLQRSSNEALCSSVDVQCSTRISDRSKEISFHVGTAHTLGLLIPLERAFARIKLKSALPLRTGDSFVLRTPGGEKTLCAGVCIDSRRARGLHREAGERLALWDGTPEGYLRFALKRDGILAPYELAENSIFSERTLREIIERSTDYISPGRDVWVLKRNWEEDSKRLLQHLAELRKEEKGLAPVELKRFFRGRSPAYVEYLKSALKEQQKIRTERGLVVAREEDRTLTPEEEGICAKLLAHLDLHGGAPTSLTELMQEERVKRGIFNLVRAGSLVSVGADHFCRREYYEGCKGRVIEHLRAKGAAATSELRELLNTSRKNAVFILEQMDRERLTYLKDNVRRLLRV